MTSSFPQCPYCQRSNYSSSLYCTQCGCWMGSKKQTTAAGMHDGLGVKYYVPPASGIDGGDA